jgi:chemotaxis protein histidine kinase CheA
VNVSVDIYLAKELMSSYEDHNEILQESLSKLSHNTDDAELINTAFRSMHTIKGNAAMMEVTPIVDYTHEIEEVISAMRSGYFTATPLLCDLILTAVDRLKDLHNKYLFNKDITPIPEKDIAQCFGDMAKARKSEEIEAHCLALRKLFYPDQNIEEESSQENSIIDQLDLSTVGNHQDYLSLTEEQKEDLLFFRILAHQVDAQNHFWDKRTDLQLYLAIKANELSEEKKIDLAQLVAAVYMHDSGMAFVADAIVNKNAKLNPMETRKLQQHPVWSYNLLKRMQGWNEAAEIVVQHHERIDGEGYPYQLTGDKLTEGAKLLAILDAYYAMTHLRADRSHRRSIMRAISEINACIDTQFCGYWVGVFNQVLRLEVKAGNI